MILSLGQSMLSILQGVMTMSDTKKMIEVTDLTIDRTERLDKLVVDGWDMETMVDYAER